MKKKYCLACEIEDKKTIATEEIDGVDLCKSHASVYYKRLECIMKKE